MTQEITARQKPYPFTIEQMQHFKEEIHNAGSTDNLMLQKEALKNDEKGLTIIYYEDIEAYKAKYLIGIYEPLQPELTQVPYVLWSRLYDALLKEGSIT